MNAIAPYSVSNILEKYISGDQYFLVGQEIWEGRATVEQQLETARILLKNSLDRRPSYGFCDEDQRKLAACAYQAIKQLKDYPQLERQALWNLMGHQAVPQETGGFLDALILKNHLHYKLNRLGIASEKDPRAILVNREWIPVGEIEEREGKFYRVGKLLFKTDESYKLDGYFFCGERGIIPGSPTTGIVDGVETVEGDGKYYVMVGTAVHSTIAPRLAGDHSYMGLIDKNGKSTSFGQYGMTLDPQFLDFVAVCAHKAVGVESPDRYRGLPYTSCHILEKKIEVTEEQYNRLKEIAIEDITNGVEGSLLEDNCTGYVGNTLKKVGIVVKTSTTSTIWATRWLLPKVLPQFLVEPLYKWGESLPNFVKILLHYLTPIYLINILYALFQSIASVEAKKGVLNILNLNYILRAVFLPWLLTVNNPSALRDWQLRQHE